MHKTRFHAFWHKVIVVASATVLSTTAAWSQTPSPALLVLNKDDNALAIVDPGSHKVVGTVPTGVGPHEVTVSPDGKWAYVSNYGSFGPNAAHGHTISVIDLVYQKQVRQVELGALLKPHGIDFADGKVYFTAELSRTIGRYDPATSQVDWVMGTGQSGTHMLFPTRDLGKIFTTNVDSDSVSIFERSKDPSGWSETVIAVGKGPEGASLSPDEKQFWTANSHDGTVSIIDVPAREVRQTIDVGTQFSNRLKFTPDGRLVLITDLRAGDVIVVDVASKKVLKRVKVGRSAEGILVVPDGSLAYVAATGDNKVVILDLKKLEVAGEFHTGTGPDGMAWSVQ